MQYTKEILEGMVKDGYFHIPTPTGKNGKKLKNVKMLGVKVIDINDINKNVVEGQVRVNDNISKRTDSLGKSFQSGGISSTEMLPSIERRKDGKYELVDGFGRDAKDKRKKNKYGVYLIVEFGAPIAKRVYRAWTNNYKPSTTNSEKDLVYTICDGIEKLEMKNDEKDIRDFLDEAESHRDPVVIDRVVSQVMDRQRTPEKPNEKTWTYTNSEVKSEFIDKHWSDVPSYGFNISGGKSGFNEEGKVFQNALQTGHVVKKLYSAADLYDKEGKQTEFLLHANGSVNETNLWQKRLALWEGIMHYKRVHYKNQPRKWEASFNFFGFLPQSVDEDRKILITIEEVKKMVKKLKMVKKSNKKNGSK